LPEWYTRVVPTTKPRFQVTDTGRTSALLDRAARSWPELAGDRKALLMRLVETGAEQLPGDGDELEQRLREHVGEWVAIGGGRLLVAAAEAGDVVSWLRERGERAEQVFRVPARAEQVVSGHGAA
jgi:hypothetical protein